MRVEAGDAETLDGEQEQGIQDFGVGGVQGGEEEDGGQAGET